MDTQNPAMIFASVLKECAPHPPALGVWCWLLPLSRQLGLTDEKAIELAEAFPHLHEELLKQSTQLSDIYRARKAEQLDQIEEAIKYYQSSVEYLEMEDFDWLISAFPEEADVKDDKGKGKD